MRNTGRLLYYHNTSKSVSFEVRWYCVVGLHYYHSTWGLGEFLKHLDMKKEKMYKSIFDDMYLELMTRCIAEMAIAKEAHHMFNHCLN